MAHEVAKLLLEHSGTFLERQEAIRSAISLGMPLREIEEYLDWLDATRPRRNGDGDSVSGPNPEDSDGRPDAADGEGNRPPQENAEHPNEVEGGDPHDRPGRDNA